MKNWCTVTATLGPIGYLPISGTIATVVSMPLVYWLDRMGVSVYEYVAICGLVLIGALLVTRSAIRMLRHSPDPSEIVIDEVVGTLITFVGISWSVQSAVCGFILFRFFDTSKLFGISYVERLPDEWGIVLDDVCAGIISNLLLRLIMQEL